MYCTILINLAVPCPQPCGPGPWLKSVACPLSPEQFGPFWSLLSLWIVVPGGLYTILGRWPKLLFWPPWYPPTQPNWLKWYSNMIFWVSMCASCGEWPLAMSRYWWVEGSDFWQYKWSPAAKHRSATHRHLFLHCNLVKAAWHDHI